MLGDALLTMVFGPKKSRDKTKTIPKPRTMNVEAPGRYGGPAFVDDQRPAPVSWVGMPWSPQIGDELDTLERQQELASRGGQSQDFYRLAGRAGDDNRHNTLSQETIVTDFPNAEIEKPHHNAVVPRPAPVERWTAHGHKELGSYTRPFDQVVRRRFTGDHFSMADHRRDYPIFQMTPVNQRRNTFRLEPAPWDTNLVDMVDTDPPATSGYQSTVAQNAPTNRSYRLA
jgi:hypothetical protein